MSSQLAANRRRHPRVAEIATIKQPRLLLSAADSNLFSTSGVKVFCEVKCGPKSVIIICFIRL